MKKDQRFYSGCLLGGAIGDALGAPIEFMDLSQIRRIYGKSGIADYVEHRDGTGEFTDDTQMTLFTAEALLRAQHRAVLRGIGGALYSIAHGSYLRWLLTQGIETPGVVRDGWLLKNPELYNRRAPGNTCISSLRSGKAGSIGNPVNNSKGCGTIMRMAPVGLMFQGNNRHAFDAGCHLSAITHGHPSGFLSGGFFASVISDLSTGLKLRRSIKNAVQILKRWNNHHETLKAVEKALELAEQTKSKVIEITAETLESLGGGWVAEEALSIGIYVSLIYETDFRKGILCSVNHSGDSDSTGSITGNILGLINGLDKIPERWVRNLRGRDIVETIAQDLHLGFMGDTYNLDEEWWEKYPGY